MLAALAVFALVSEIAMAKPPEPLEEIFPSTHLIVEGVVVELVTEDADVAPRTADIPKQVIVLQVTCVVRGKLSDDEKKTLKLTATKPKAPYKLRVGVKGPWLLHVDDKTGEKTILGRYGPDSWTLEKIDLKLKEIDPPHLR